MPKPSNLLKKLFKSRRSKKDVEEIDEIGAQWPQQFTFGTLVSATKGFDGNNKLGEGGFGHVYKGTLDDGTEIAVKRCKQTSDQGKEVFKNEVKLLGPLHHRNVVKFLGYCSHRDSEGSEEMLLVCEYVANGSLDKLLFVSGTGGRAEALDWKRTYDIIVDIAQGLFYLLHSESQSVTIHRDIKPANILIDENWVAKIGDFGTALLFPRDHTHVNINEHAGTDGYKAPESVMFGTLSPKADVFSYGVVILEMVSGQKNWFPRPESLLCKADELYQNGKSLEFLDPKLVSSADPDQVKLCVQIGVMCTNFNPKLRPTMEDVISMLPKKHGTTPPEEPRTDGHTSSYASSSTPPYSGPTELANNGSYGPDIKTENLGRLPKHRQLTRAARIRPEDVEELPKNPEEVEGLPKHRQLTRAARIRPEDVEGLPLPDDVEGLPKHKRLTRVPRIRRKDMSFYTPSIPRSSCSSGIQMESKQALVGTVQEEEEGIPIPITKDSIQTKVKLWPKNSSDKASTSSATSARHSRKTTTPSPPASITEHTKGFFQKGGEEKHKAQLTSKEGILRKVGIAGDSPLFSRIPLPSLVEQQPPTADEAADDGDHGAARIRPEDVEGLPLPEDVEGLPKHKRLTRVPRIRRKDRPFYTPSIPSSSCSSLVEQQPPTADEAADDGDHGGGSVNM